ncbi:MAG TPA: Gfo/Idh/MocA family oxidoreductase, partial [Armatimonadota bacterium]|nr:Gfo/Idh/MocA family oxidoreductase [Armatimonadota bacterium]
MSQIDASIRTLNVGVIGCGMLASTTHIPNSAANPGLNLRWLCDINAPLLREQAERYGVEHTTADYHALLQDPALDLVVLATTHTLRAEAIEAAARAGKAVYVEKPMAGSTQDVARTIMADLRKLPGVRANAMAPGGLRVGMGSPVQAVIGGPDYE